MDERAVPLRSEPCPTGAERPDYREIRAEVLGNREPAREPLGDLRVHVGHEPPAVLDPVRGTVAAAEHARDPGRRVPAQPVDPELLEPLDRAVAQEPPDLRPAVVGSGIAPRRRRALILVEIDPALPVLGPAVELPDVEVRRTEVVVDDVEEDGDPGC